MTTLEAIGFSIAGSSLIAAFSLASFGVAVAYRSPFIAPRATARPRDVIHNPRPQHSSQSRGSAMLGWIPWTLSLTYDTLLQGVPGTGTREGGLSGSLLKVNLDGIVLLRFHSLGLRISAFAMVICLGIILPMNLTGNCEHHTQSLEFPEGCEDSSNHTITNYERTTMANIPALVSHSDADELFFDIEVVRLKLYVIVVAFWAILAYTCFQLKREWIEVLAIRRVYYLEHDVWGARKEELKQTLLFEEMAQQRLKAKNHFTFEERNKGMLDGSVSSKGARGGAAQQQEDEDNKHLTKRPPWMPHPEQRDTVPNVALYSLLVGGLPSLPEEAADSIDKEANIQFSKRDSIDWQLSLTATFFDHCVPNQPGFSSSVAAVTIAPPAKELAIAWRKWYAAAAKLRRLRFIRELISERRRYDIEIEDVYDGADGNNNHNAANELISPRDTQDVESGQIHKTMGGEQDDDYETTPRGIYDDLNKNKDYYRAVLGVNDEENDDIYDSLTFGPEQAAVYSREFAQAAAPCCPVGCFPDRLRHAPIDELMRLEEEVKAEVHEANEALVQARWSVTHAGPASAEETPPNDIEAVLSADIGSSNHRAKPSLQGAKLPSELQLEAELYNQSEVNQPPIPTGRKFSRAEPKNNRNPPAVPPSDNVSPDLRSSTSTQPPSNLQWQKVETLVRESANGGREKSNRSRGSTTVSSGTWSCPTLRSLLGRTTKHVSKRIDVSQADKLLKSSAEAVESLSRDSTFAIVTFTSRQAAVAARHCLADGRGAQRWIALEDLPIPPLADASACDLLAFRNCCRPLALGVNERQKNCRYYSAMTMLGVLYFFYTIPLTFASRLVDPTTLDELFPSFAEWSEELDIEVTQLVSGFVTAMIWSTFFALCPVLFKAIANFGSKATSVASAEFRALQYYWWFMVVTAFTNTILVNIALNGLNEGLSLGSEFRSVVLAVARTIPTTVSVNWLNWIVFRMLATLPFSYLLQANTFLFHAVGMKCCSRVVMGGGPGGASPYRIFVDSGVVIMCALALGPASPLVTAACFCYFVVCQPLFRRNLIFVYRPKFDGGGFRWPFVFDMCISAMVVASILLAGQMGLKEAVLPAILAAVPLAPILAFQKDMRKRYLRAFNDAALLQTSLLDGWNTTEKSTVKKREEFRRFLVDAHKAAYVPVCLAGAQTHDFLTAEPAVTVPIPSDTDGFLDPFGADDFTEASPQTSVVLDRTKSQRGATMRRSLSSIPRNRRRTISKGSVRIADLIADDEDLSVFSPFQRSSGAHLIPMSEPHGQGVEEKDD